MIKKEDCIYGACGRRKYGPVITLWKTFKSDHPELITFASKGEKWMYMTGDLTQLDELQQYVDRTTIFHQDFQKTQWEKYWDWISNQKDRIMHANKMESLLS